MTHKFASDSIIFPVCTQEPVEKRQKDGEAFRGWAMECAIGVCSEVHRARRAAATFVDARRIRSGVSVSLSLWGYVCVCLKM